MWSKNEKVDSVGACVGMRGNRVRNIVNELHGEKIDIVRFNDDIKEYIKAALSPAKVAEIKLDKEKVKAEVIVDDDQLSLSIGRHGQNVRLASRLIGWELDIRTKSAPVESEKAKPEEGGPALEEGLAKEIKKEKKTKKAKKIKKESKSTISLEMLSGVGEKILASLKEADIDSLEDIVNSNVADLTKIKGIGEKKAGKLIQEAKKLIG